MDICVTADEPINQLTADYPICAVTHTFTQTHTGMRTDTHAYVYTHTSEDIIILLPL